MSHAPQVRAPRARGRAVRTSPGEREGGALLWLGALLALYLMLPLAGLVVSLASSHGAGTWTPELRSALYVSIATATITTAICAVLGVPLAYGIARSPGRFSGLVGVVVLLPLALPPLMGGILLVSVLGPDTILGRLFGGRLTDSMAGIVLAQTFVAAPFTIQAARSAFASVDGALLDVAHTLGLGAWGRFAQVSLPIAARGVGAGLVLTWLRAFGEFGATVILAYHPYSLPVLTYVRFGGFGLRQAMAPTVASLAVALCIVALTRPRPHRRRGSRIGVPPPVPPPLSPPVPPPLSPPVPPGERRDRDGSEARAGRGHAADPIAFDLDRHFGAFHLRLAYAASSPHLAILGPSGAGKTSVLRCLAGLVGHERPAGAPRAGAHPGPNRSIGYVPQEPSLVPRRNVWRQVTLGPGATPALASYWIARLGLGGLEGRFPDELSGGQSHRVAIARALCRSPEVLLLDEPFTGLDTPVRTELRREIRAVQRAGDFATVLVTHDPEEAAMLADEILIIADGRLLQAGAREEVFARPATPEVARLVGISNIHEGRIASPGVIHAGGVAIRLPEGTALSSHPVRTPVLWCIRPEHVSVRPIRGRAGEYCGGGHADERPAVVVDAIDLGSAVETRVSLEGGTELVARAARSASLAVGSRCLVRVPAEHVTAWPAASGAAGALGAAGASGASGAAGGNPISLPGAPPGSCPSWRPSRP